MQIPVKFERCPNQLRERRAVTEDVLGDEEKLTFVSCQDKCREQEAIDEWRLNPKRFSSWIHLVQLHARVRRVIHNMFNPENRQNNKELLPEEIRDAEEKIVQRAQQEAFREEYEALERKKPIQHSILLKLLIQCLTSKVA